MSIRFAIYYILLLSCVLFTGCDENIEPDLTAYLETDGEIPAEIWAGLDEETQEAIAEGTKYVALTFDDGPRYETTSILLDGLAQRGVQATFFVIGTQIMCGENKELLLRMKEEGHQVGNHTFSHARLMSVQLNTAAEEIRKNDVILKTVLGPGSYWLRPPYGLIDSTRAELVKTPMIHWTLDPEDWKLLDAGKVADCVVQHVEDGDIILLHDFYPSSVEAALQIIDRLQPEGYSFVTVEELFRIQGIKAQPGVLYAAPNKLRPLC